VTDKGLKDTVRLLDKRYENPAQTPANTPGSPPPSTPAEENQQIDQSHQEKIREVVRTIGRGMSVPSCMDKDLWRDLPIEFEPGTYHLSIGTVEIDIKKEIKFKYPDRLSGVAPHLTRGVLSHMRTSGIDRFTELVGESGYIANLSLLSGQYSEGLMSLLKIIADDIKATGENIEFHGEQKPGLTREFILTVWIDAIQVTQGHRWIRDSWYAAPQIVQGTDMLQQKCGAFIISFAKDQSIFDIYNVLHNSMRAKYAKNQIAKALAVQHRELGELVQNLRQRLEEFSDYQNIPGRCELC
jgi:hypothetical protein